MAPGAALPSRDELAVWRRYIETFEILQGRVQARLQSDSRLSSGDYRVLLALSEAPERSLRSSHLAAHIEWERSRLSGHLGRMEARGLVERMPFPEDARGSIVAMTDEGARAFRASTLPHLRAIRELFVDAFSDEELAQLDALTSTVRRHLHLPERP